MEEKTYAIEQLDEKDLITLECVLGEKKARLRDFYVNPMQDCELYRRISTILDEVRRLLGWE